MTVPYPESLPDALRQTRGQFEQEAWMAMAVKLSDMARISSGAAAISVGMDRVAFLMKLHEYSVAMIQGDADELRSGLKHA